MKKPATRKHDALLADALEALAAKGLPAAISTITSSNDPEDAGVVFVELGKRLYRDRKDVSGMIASGEAGVEFCLQGVKRAPGSELAGKLKKIAKVIAFNTATNCWPGWGDDGVRIERAHLQSALTFAAVCRDLVDELQLGPKEVGNAHWLLGALKLASGESTEASREFQRAQQAFDAGGLAAYALMTRGYDALARKAEAKSAADGSSDLATALKQLRDEGSNDATFFADQIAIAEKILLAR
ncbi:MULTISPECIES: hypothetical protein [unclassified Bradyrhizobium]|uniref:hypothetical protein n=1 Tax=unclassified Bradyrhizobium TaxID=2631580 RepID=UPI00291681A2|nr:MULTISPECIES: hypothetical protein [unclassified Bradyrhizobium]